MNFCTKQIKSKDDNSEYNHASTGVSAVMDAATTADDPCVRLRLSGLNFALQDANCNQNQYVACKVPC